MGVTKVSQIISESSNIYVVMFERNSSTFVVVHIVQFYSFMQINKILFSEFWVLGENRF